MFVLEGLWQIRAMEKEEGNVLYRYDFHLTPYTISPPFLSVFFVLLHKVCSQP
jgi:hypothetical protein